LPSDGIHWPEARRRVLGEKLREWREQRLERPNLMELTRATRGAPSYQTLRTLEKGVNNAPSLRTKTSAERFYKLKYGTLDRFMAGEIGELEPASELADDHAEQIEFQRELEEFRHHVRSALALADRIGSRCQGDEPRSQSAVG
jgi:hypothetical protein